MTLEAVVFQQGLFDWYNNNIGSKELGICDCDFESEFIEQEENKQMILQYDDMNVWDPSSSTLVQKLTDDPNNTYTSDTPLSSKICPSVIGRNCSITGRKKRPRMKSMKNKAEVESQRMTHITVERNRRKQMNEYLAILRSLMPPSYAHRGDQASIVGGAINYVKELEQLLHSLEVQKRLKQQEHDYNTGEGLVSPFADFFTFPQYSCGVDGGNHCGVADIEVTMVERHVNLKVMSRRRSGQLVKIIAGLQDVYLMPLHLNVTNVEKMVLYNFSLKVEDNCSCNSVDDIATVVYQMLKRIQEEANC